MVDKLLSNTITNAQFGDMVERFLLGDHNPVEMLTDMLANDEVVVTALARKIVEERTPTEPDPLHALVRTQLEQHFGSEHAGPTILIDEIVEAAGGDRESIMNAIDAARDFQASGKVIQHAGRLVKWYLKQKDPLWTAAQANSFRERKNKNPQTLVEEVMRETENRVKTLPPKRGPNADRSAKLSAMAARAKEVGLSEPTGRS